MASRKATTHESPRTTSSGFRLSGRRIVRYAGTMREKNRPGEMTLYQWLEKEQLAAKLNYAWTVRSPIGRVAVTVARSEREARSYFEDHGIFGRIERGAESQQAPDGSVNIIVDVDLSQAETESPRPARRRRRTANEELAPRRR
jgi:hypothetical protein